MKYFSLVQSVPTVSLLWMRLIFQTAVKEQRYKILKLISLISTDQMNKLTFCTQRFSTALHTITSRGLKESRLNWFNLLKIKFPGLISGHVSTFDLHVFQRKVHLESVQHHIIKHQIIVIRNFTLCGYLFGRMYFWWHKRIFTQWSWAAANSGNLINHWSLN